jgi:hypothetical protein
VVVPTLGWVVLGWLTRHLTSPRDETAPYRPADWQARRTLRWYELRPDGHRMWNRVHDEDPKGKGKSPHAGATAIAEFRGPVVFAGWAKPGDVYACRDHGCSCGWVYPYEPGEAMGRPWGSPGLPSPWVQVAAVSEAQTANTWAALHAFLAANDGRLAQWLDLDAGRTLVYWRARVDAKIERVTSSAATRTGQPLTHAVMDEPQEWTTSVGGPVLANTILENLTKLDGWAHFTGNAPVLGRGSVAETLREPAPRALHLAPRPSVEPRENMTRDELRPLVAEVYEGTPWAPIERILDDIEDRVAHPWPNSKRLFLNVPVDGSGANAWLDVDAWHAAAGPVSFDQTLPVGVGVHKAPRGEAGAIVVAQRQGARFLVRCRTFATMADGSADTDAMREYLRLQRAVFPAPCAADPKTKVPVPGPAIAYARWVFGESAEMLSAEGLHMVEFPLSSTAMLGPASTFARELVLTGRLTHEPDVTLDDHVAATDTVLTEHGMKVVPRGLDSTRRNHAAIALVMALAMARQDAPAPRRMATFRSA